MASHQLLSLNIRRCTSFRAHPRRQASASFARLPSPRKLMRVEPCAHEGRDPGVAAGVSAASAPHPQRPPGRGRRHWRPCGTAAAGAASLGWLRTRRGARKQSCNQRRAAPGGGQGPVPGPCAAGHGAAMPARSRTQEAATSKIAPCLPAGLAGREKAGRRGTLPKPDSNPPTRARVRRDPGWPPRWAGAGRARSAYKPRSPFAPCQHGTASAVVARHAVAKGLAWSNCGWRQ
jgi:hypothetical protein